MEEEATSNERLMSAEGYAYISLVLPGPTAIHNDCGEEDCIVLIKAGKGGNGKE